MAIYPIVAGQKASQRNLIPPHKASTPATEVPPKLPGGGDLIDFGNDEPDTTPAQPAQAAPVGAEKERSASKDIEGMLSQTGAPAPDGPLIDFAGDLKKAVPELKRADTSGDDEFHDAKE